MRKTPGNAKSKASDLPGKRLAPQMSARLVRRLPQAPGKVHGPRERAMDIIDHIWDTQKYNCLFMTSEISMFCLWFISWQPENVLALEEATVKIWPTMVNNILLLVWHASVSDNCQRCTNSEMGVRFFSADSCKKKGALASDIRSKGWCSQDCDLGAGGVWCWCRCSGWKGCADPHAFF